MDCDPASIRDVVITHLHYDHAGNLNLFPNARFHLQDREMQFATGRHMCMGCMRGAFDVEDVVIELAHGLAVCSVSWMRRTLPDAVRGRVSTKVMCRGIL